MFCATTVGIAGATWSGCSGTATAYVGKVHVRKGPLGTSAENMLNPSDERFAITFSLSGSCWVAGRILFTAGAGAEGTVRKPFPREAKSVA